MASMDVSLSDPIRDWIQSRVDNGTYPSASDYASDFIQREQMLSWLDEAVARGLAEADAGLGRDLDEVCDEREAKYTRMIE
jgi:antitoxin ParD1/3/4